MNTRRNHSFVIGAVLAAAATLLTACDSDQDTAAAPSASSAPAPSGTAVAPPASVAPDETSTASASVAPTGKATAAPARPTAGPTTKAKVTSDLSELRITGIRAGKSVLIDVAGDGVDRFLQVGRSAVNFTGTGRTDSTMMALYPAAVSAENRVVIKPPFWNEEAGGGYCVADTAGAPLKLETCQDGKASQVWRVALAGDSGLFELHGAYGVIRVKDGRITTGEDGDTGLQVLPYAQ
ncbi:hypothetical protein [Micromonospora endophytica]|uniref:Uncharacterized protein n=1 Tax=Micromonospora endophytica TaxID=515350 RepID=A0A2W2CXE6_9ACTN|nr:hypothetical protein [Micromonospora endophytica]PZF93069.1 hypothetical protein C1I93_18480 [Micromonospora endophytica]RIW45668.1 hypothetical protein D3H59_14615 [Micromonospora endophytica]BCJ58888.1 hypothetical protein Jiend_23100 [Micromonospora endophytica]